ncbi:MAG: gamma-glutamyltransferase [Mesorhizobium sp.]|uniref:gamma-glutamyltransferase n=5 Tax=Mesorhizobium TaxID=68287 RepID=UPI000F757F2A|nr:MULTISPECIES: gamma-glutamyltransferase [unclassified Mesorhizobium]RVC71965.1 gamma-glutamyltransferase [Mesorhizobium sp. M2A.F.Ca.ET.046.02.1.1]AZO33739.1 gamma-glutamyltransferase [Mesorhizobium sp. M2A.F.Ca.ET.046.03.2.1]RWA81587.1 MAG: gamma-glutamyltransferase [Mesorhizobium sp.]RWB37791.1 MAG: gamma-glutamyltransferase [Mesorhizobium sp.]RWE89949.1 MAG: gamma-glutamyltransferase [Mesorhizobium sp.]
MRDFQFPGRSPVRATEAMAATSHPLATLAAIDMLRAGGNAMDAAVCAAAVQAVVEPQSTGIGGDCFVLYCPKGQGEVIAFNGSGRAPAAATVDWYRDKGFSELPLHGPHAVTVPGAVDAWCRLLEDHGRKGLADALAPAIRYAEEGYVVHDRVAFDWHDPETDLSADEVATRIFLPGGRPPKAGDIHRQPELAETLRIIAKKGRAGFYEGAVAGDLVGRLRALGGLHTLEDFAATKGDYRTPVSTSYRGHDIHQMPPNNQGLTALLMLNVLSGFDLGRLDPEGAERLHLEIEAGRLAYQDRDAFFADQDHVDVPVQALLSSAYADSLRAAIDSERAMTHLPRLDLPGSDTVYISVVDRDRNAVSFINSTYYSFGSGVVGPKTGVVLQNRGSSFRLDPKHPNAIAPGKRPMHTIMPGMMTRNGRAMMPFGVMGGGYQPFGHVHLVTNMIDFGMDPQQAIDAARVFYNHDVVEAERSVHSDAVEGLRRRGHRVVEPDHPLGGGQAVLIDWEKGTLTGASDPRKDGLALGF